MNLDAVSKDLLATLKSLMGLECLKLFALGGGTSFALRFRHRSSVDIELFFERAFDTQVILDSFLIDFHAAELLNRTKGSLCVSLKGIKVDILQHSYPRLAAFEEENGIRMLSVQDVAAMKINAVTNRGSKKDFIDLLALNEHGIPLGAALDLFCKKYGPAGKFLVIRSLSFFDDAEEEPDPVFLNEWTWEYVKGEMTELTARLLR